MNVYITAGTVSFLKIIESKHPKENMVTMVNENGALLLHETDSKTVFNQPRKYEVLLSYREIQNEGYVTIIHIPVTDEGRPLFEHQIKIRTQGLNSEPGLIAYRILRPISSNTYVLLTVWETEAYYQKWQKSEEVLLGDHNKLKDYTGQENIFVSAPYASKYSILKKT